MNEKYEKQAEIIKKNIEIVLEDIYAHKDRMCSAIHSKRDYGNEAVFAFGNYIVPDINAEKPCKIIYRIFISVMDYRSENK